jgi:hypothetical protein
MFSSSAGSTFFLSKRNANRSDSFAYFTMWREVVDASACMIRGQASMNIIMMREKILNRQIKFLVIRYFPGPEPIFRCVIHELRESDLNKFSFTICKLIILNNYSAVLSSSVSMPEMTGKPKSVLHRSTRCSAGCYRIRNVRYVPIP